VEILAFCFMPNHIHLLLKQTKNEGISKFMKKVGTGYGRYFNQRYGRKGYVFQNRFLAIYVKDDNQLKIVFTYIHINPVSLIEPKWKEVGIRDSGKVVKFLENYKWSSYLDYINKKNFPSVVEKDFMLKLMGEEKGCKEFIENWIMYKKELSVFNGLSLES
jgi:putative transposase